MGRTLMIPIHRQFHLHVLFVCLLLWANHSLAQERGRALIIGIGQYTAESGSTPLLGIGKDLSNARKMALAMGIPNHGIQELRDSEATKTNIIQALNRLKQEVQAGERVFIYFSGHGTRYSTPKGCREGLVPYTPGRLFQGDEISEGELAQLTSKISEKADKAIVMIDSCFSGGLGASTTRSILPGLDIRAKFTARSGQACNTGVNEQMTRSFVPAMQRLGQPEQNFVQISAANYNEVSWDSKDYGGLATHNLTACLLGDAKDLNRSGAVSLDEIRQCAQGKLNGMMAPNAKNGQLPSTIQVRGSRNLIVVQDPPKPVVQTPPKPPTQTAVAPPTPVRPPAVEAVAQAPVASAPLIPAPQVQAPQVPVPQVPVPQVQTPQPAEELSATTSVQSVPQLESLPDQLIASVATLEDIHAQRNARLKLDVVAPQKLKIGKDLLTFNVRSNTDGYLYAVMLGSDGKSFYLLYPNKIDQNNKIKANVNYSFPKNGWSVAAGGPKGTNHMLFVVSQSPRDAKIFSPDENSGGGLFTYSLAEMTARQRLIDFFVGRGVKGRNGQLASALIQIEEVE